MTTSISTKIFNLLLREEHWLESVSCLLLPSSELLCDHLVLHKGANGFKQVVYDGDLTFEQEHKTKNILKLQLSH